MSESTLILRVAGLTVGLGVRDARMRSLMADRYRGYQAAGAMPLVTIRCTFRRGHGRLAGEPSVVVRTEGKARSVARDDFECRWEGNVGWARIRRSVYSFDAFLRVLLATLGVDHRTLFVHAAAVRLGSKCLVLAGPSGSGKTTAARNVVSDGVVNDEICGLSIDAGGTVNVWGTPFWGEMGTGPASPTSFGIVALCFLGKGPTSRASRVGQGQAAPRLLRCVCTFGNDAAGAQEVLDLVSTVVAGVPAYDLRLERAPVAWESLPKEGLPGQGRAIGVARTHDRLPAREGC